MEAKPAKSLINRYQWLLFFYSVPSKPVSNRMTVWRKLMKAGAIPLKGAVYILPCTAEHYEFLQWLVVEIKAMQGDATIISIDKVDTTSDSEIIALFNQARQDDYLAIRNDLEELTRKLDNITKGGQGQGQKWLTGQFDKIVKAFAGIEKLDFFASAEGSSLRPAIELVRNELDQLLQPPEKMAPTVSDQKLAADYRGRTWATRRAPFVDRMASAWLIRRWIDPDAVFQFIEEEEVASLPPTAIVFDVYGGEFTHSGDLCTFEVLCRAFGLKDKALKQIAETVHDLDLKDGRYQAAAASGVERILAGIRKTAPDDHAALTQGMQVFEMLYQSKKS